MGLDISAYSKIKAIDAHIDEDGYAIDNKSGEEVSERYFTAWKNPDFPGRADDVSEDVVYSYENANGHGVGYVGHFHWRDELSKMSGYPIAEYKSLSGTQECHLAGAWNSDQGPFWELLNFSDCEGVIGTAVSAKLHVDFEKYESAAKEIGGRFYELYANWKSAFKLASDSGCVIFH